MYHVIFPETSNRATWIFTGQISDMDNNPLDLTGLTLVFEIRDIGGCQRLLATTDNGKLTIIGTGLFRWEFSKDEMSSLCAGSYDTGMTMANTTETRQLSVGPLPVVDGNVP